MGTNQRFELDAGWAAAVATLDETFPLERGSHADVADYLVSHGHLLAIDAGGACVGLARPGQFVEAEGCAHAPCAIVLEQGGVQVEIEPARCRDGSREHRAQLLAVLAVA